MSVRNNRRTAAVVVAVVMAGAGGMAAQSLVGPSTISLGEISSVAWSAPISAAPKAVSVPTDLAASIASATSAQISFTDTTGGLGEHVLSYGMDDEVQMLTLAPGVDTTELQDLNADSDYLVTVQAIVDKTSSKVASVRFSTV